MLGLAARLGKFCTLAAMEDAMFSRDLQRLRMWALAIAVAIAGAFALSQTGTVDFSQSLYHRQSLNPVAWIFGGVLFGVGMALCGTCGYGTLARAGGGDLRALFGFLIIAIAAFMAIAGPTAELRLLALDPLAIENAPRTATQVMGDVAWLGWALPVALSLAIALWVLSDRAFRASGARVFWAIAVGLAVVSGWWATGWLGADPFDVQPVASHTYSLPLGQTLIYVMTSSSTPISFGVGATFGVLLGAFVGALIKREFRWEGADDAREMRRHILGGFLMGTGGVYAGGCTIGQGISGASVLALSAPVVLLSMWFGAWLGLSYLMEGSMMAGMKSLLNK